MESRIENVIKVCERAEALGIVKSHRITHIIDIEIADDVFHLDFDRWLKADDFNFAHDFLGIYNNIDRTSYKNHDPNTVDFNCFVPRFAQ